MKTPTGHLRISRSFPSDVTSASAARRFVRSFLNRWGYEHFHDDAALLVSELVTNATIHAASPSTVVIEATGDCVRIEVHDVDPVRVPIKRPMSQSAHDGRGMLIVDRVASQWNTELTKRGKMVWFVLEPTPAT